MVIAGLVPLSTVDWPDHLTATVFTQGCPWRCTYCHNQALIPTQAPGLVAWREVRDLLARRAGLLDGVVLTGGEPLRQAALADAAAEVREAGFAVGLHTAGAYPRRLRDLVRQGLLDWVGLDVKALPEHYQEVVGRPHAGARAWESLRVLLEAGAGRGGSHGGGLRGRSPGGSAPGRLPDVEVRTTVVPGDVTADDVYEVARRVHDMGAHTYALQQARSKGTREGFVATAPGWDAQCEDLAARIEALGWERFTYRPA
ncbi:anaerobic ribonucleoside-triphosphate reductase activating protein [Actinomyces sp. 2119]|uniref:Anaerobic ribonucleoside-triphosphate reductase activating protein n=1 Tax=Actinomyces lilanjuaniae TaxID=2321394 RepID=A0ABN5PQR5_9ACTO|nr:MULTISPECIES: anaerobic ribonucleoside-triphosphate reductase activating protein [Actinomyces]AYD90735.1 anaerobic ribonucleoside-triphosphate reductase activating protein [Actinomyces lilanjuaniae]RJF42019.1 anaerobic ribonucleoside-triphosphate reductase activating protein [Actinomyces sp. 2119]